MAWSPYSKNVVQNVKDIVKKENSVISKFTQNYQQNKLNSGSNFHHISTKYFKCGLEGLLALEVVF